MPPTSGASHKSSHDYIKSPTHGPLRAKTRWSCLTLHSSVDCILPGSSVHGIPQAKILEGVAVPGDLPHPGIEPASLMSPALAGGSLPQVPPLASHFSPLQTMLQ